MNQKNLISVLAVLVLILGGTTIYLLTAQKSVAPVVPTPTPVSQTVPVTEKTSPIVQSTPAPVVQDETAGWKTYVNNEHGFELNFPDTWKGFDATSHDGDKYSDVCFSFKQPQPFCIFQIVKFNKKQWEQAGNMKIDKNNILSKTDEATIICDGCCQQKDETGAQFNKFQNDRCKEASAIMKTFKLIQ